MDWSICVVSDCKDGTSADLSNALLYGSQLIWIPPSCAPLYEIIDMEARYADAQEQTVLKSGGEEFLPNWTASMKAISDLAKSLAANEFDFDLSYWKMLSHFADIIRSVRIRNEESLKRNIEILMKIEENVKNSHPIDIQAISNSKAEMSNSLECMREDLKSFRMAVLQIVHEMANSAHASMIFDGHFRPTMPSGWDTHQAAQELMNAMQRVLLPDVSGLTLEQVKALQGRSKDELEPMRAEMLRLTEDLRKMIGDEWNTNDLAQEAENLVATRVEPSVRELNSRIKSDVKQTGLGYGGQLLKSIGLLGFGRLFQNEKTVEKAFTEAMEFVGDKVTGLPTLKGDTPASRFVIEIKQGIKKMA